MRARLFAAAALAVLAGAPTVPAQATTRISGHHERHPVVRHTTLGPIDGVDGSRSTGTYSWLGIPYAEPPVGDLRWRAPVTHRPWGQVRRTTQYGDGCIQQGRMFSPSPGGPYYSRSVRDGIGKPVGKEDCLTLNVFRPANARKNLPVIVFFHGGSNVVGYSADPMYDGRALARKAGAVVVTVNYRLGLFGWFDLAQLKSGEPSGDSGNFGTLDQIEALRFVHRNARTFGGDPGNVTAMGESAGSVDVWALLVSPLTRGLVQKAIPQSGGLQFTTKAAATTYAQGIAADALAEHPGATDTAKVLRATPAAELVRMQVEHGKTGGDPPAVIPDGTVLPTDYHAAIASGEFRDVPVLAGNTLEEGKLFGSLVGAYRPADYDRFTMMYDFDPDRRSRLAVADFINDQYLPVDRPGGWNDAAAALTAGIFTKLTHDSMDSFAAAGGKRLYFYQFAWNREPKPFDDVYGAVHAMDLPFVFANFGRSIYSFAFSHANRPGRTALSDQLISSIRAFVRTGSPQQHGLGSRWDQWPRSMIFDADDLRADIRPGSALDPQAARPGAMGGGD